jgi:hypothetical protein
MSSAPPPAVDHPLRTRADEQRAGEDDRDETRRLRPADRRHGEAPWPRLRRSARRGGRVAPDVARPARAQKRATGDTRLSQEDVDRLRALLAKLAENITDESWPAPSSEGT